LVAAIAAVVFAYGLWWHHVALLAGGAVVLCLVLRRVAHEAGASEGSSGSARSRRVADHAKPDNFARGADGGAKKADAANRTSRVLQKSQQGGKPKSTEALVEDFLATGRYALLLRPETKKHLSQLQVVKAIRELDEAMALVPAGRVLLGQLAEQSNSTCGAADIDPKLARRNLVKVEPAYLDRFCVTNEQYQQFVDCGGYEQLE
jgi:formylglycine-generating enzyme required for sulfatase activity